MNFASRKFVIQFVNLNKRIWFGGSWDNMRYVKKKYGLTIHLALRYFKFLMKYHKEEVLSLAKMMDFLLCGSNIKIGEGSRFIQRHLYRIARENGWYKDGNDGYKWKRDKYLTESEVNKLCSD